MGVIKKQDIVLFTSAFPFGQGESFLENEIPFLSNFFNRVIIVSRTNDKLQTRKVPKNIILLRLSPKSSFRNKVRLIPHIFKNRKLLNLRIKEEKLFAQKYFGYPLKKQIVSQIWHDIFKALEIKCFFNEKIKNIIQGKAVIYSYWQDNSALALALLKEENPSYLCVCRIHRGDLYFSEQRIKYLTFREYISRTLDKLFFISEDGYQYQKQLLGIEFKSFDISRLGTMKKSQKDVGIINNSSKKIVSCSSLTPVKRVEMIIHSLEKIDKVKIDWIHFGDGPQKMEFEKLAEKLLGDKKNISYSLKGFVSNTEVHEFYSRNKIDLFLNLSSSEGIPVSIMEALSYGIPVVATDVGGNREIVDTTCGRLIHQDSSPEFIAEVMMEELMQNKTKGALNKWNTQYSASKNYRSFLEKIIKIHENR
jgi:glycosyltransferase involved in cell wall biosynthesis